MGPYFETFANLSTGTWTIVNTQPTGLSCMLAAGEGFELVNEPLEKAGAEL